MLLDAHSHLNGYDLLEADSLGSALKEIVRQRIFTVANSMDLPAFKRNREIAGQCDLVLPVFGVHPWYAPEYARRLSELNEAIAQSPMFGEIGLDYHFVDDPAAYPDQEKVFEYFLAAASKQDKIIILHTKGAEREALRMLNRHRIRRAVVHWYSGPLKTFRDMIAWGAWFTVGVEVLYSQHVRNIAAEIPAGRLLTETDNPGGPKEFIGKPGSPALLLDVIRELALIRKTTEEDIVRTVQANFLELIRDDPRLAGPCELLTRSV